MPSFQYTDPIRIQSRLGSLGFGLSLDDQSPAKNATTINDVIDWASDIGEGYVSFAYSLANLATNSWFAQQITDLACSRVRSRRGNPPPESIKEAADEALMRLEQVRTGRFKIPGAPQVKGAAPAIANMRVSQRPFNHVVVEPFRSRTAGCPTMDNYTPNRDLTEWYCYGSDPAGVGLGIVG